MAGGGATAGSRELDQTPTWAVAAVCAGIVLISILLEKVLHSVGTVTDGTHSLTCLACLCDVHLSFLLHSCGSDWITGRARGPNSFR